MNEKKEFFFYHISETSDFERVGGDMISKFKEAVAATDSFSRKIQLLSVLSLT